MADTGSTRGRLVPALPAPVWALLAGEGVAAVGGGMALPFLVVYLHHVRGIALPVAGLALAWLAAVGLLGNPLGGWLADRLGARRTLVSGLVMVAIGGLAAAAIRSPWQAFAATGVIGFGAAVVWPAQEALLATLVDAALRSRAFAMRYATMNFGIAIGGALAAVIADAASPRSFELLFVLQAASFVIYAAIASRLPEPAAAGSSEASGGEASFRTLLRDKTLLRILPLIALLFAIGYGQYDAAFAAYATGPGGVATSGLAIAFAANAATVVLAQLVVCKLVASWRRSRGLATTAAVWAIAWLLTLAAGHLGGGAMATAGFAGALTLFGIGETIAAPMLGPLVNDLAPDALRGRYNGASALASTVGFMLAPLIAGVALAAGHGDALLLALFAGCAAAVALACRIGRRLPARIDLPAAARAVIPTIATQR
jgi:MFS family permease